MIPTAEEFLIDWTGVDNSTHPNEELRNNFIQSKNQMIEFAKLHVQAALASVRENVALEANCHWEGVITGHAKFDESCDYWIQEDSILNAYPKEIIK